MKLKVVANASLFSANQIVPLELIHSFSCLEFIPLSVLIAWLASVKLYDVLIISNTKLKLCIQTETVPWKLNIFNDSNTIKLHNYEIGWFDNPWMNWTKVLFKNWSKEG